MVCEVQKKKKKKKKKKKPTERVCREVIIREDHSSLENVFTLHISNQQFL